ncbi:NAD(P)H-hydrate dehydratase [Mesorhizobium xinjiangense]|uniref:NAD(P)H-hydrate dehydratase n=1 Tax=Mesorhizobium xinjiangense TaxID=2678685 RepID=UPI0012EDA72A|nr:NAD(P)H-hydrate dehydratase [Mesorhizobium xinjiangense]
MMIELPTPAQMSTVDRLAIERGPHDGYGLMLRAGQAVAADILAHYPAMAAAHILCGGGNNGGDGYVVARLLAEAGVAVRIWREKPPKPGTDAARAEADCPVAAEVLERFSAKPGDVVVDALFGAGLSGPVRGPAAQAIIRANASGAATVAVDLPSGVSGETGQADVAAIRAARTVTFFRRKPGHLLQPGRSLCGPTVVADIGIAAEVLDEIGPRCFENAPALWAGAMPAPGVEAHKYARGHAAVFSGGPANTGAARLAALAAARAGAGAVTVLSPANALMVNAAHLTSIMLRKIEDTEDLVAFVGDRNPSAMVIGPAFGVGERCRAFVKAILANAADSDGRHAGLVFDADAITSFCDTPDELFAAIGAGQGVDTVLTPHEGEFRRLFPDIAAQHSVSKVERARLAARRAEATLVYKGPDTVIASPDGRAAINANGTPWLATAGSGDVLAGIIAGLMAQAMPAFEAAATAVWLHAEAGRRFGPGLIAEDLPGLLPEVLGEHLGSG